MNEQTPPDETPTGEQPQEQQPEDTLVQPEIPAEQSASPPPAAGAGAASYAAASDEARRRTRTATMVAGGALFALVFTFLGYQLKSGNDPSLSSDRTRGLWSQQDQQQGQFQGPPSSQSQQGDGWGDWGDDDEGDDDGGSWGGQSQGQQGQSAPPMSRAS